MSEKAERNAEIFRRYQAGESALALARTFGVSHQAITYTVRREGVRRGEPLRKPLRSGVPRKPVSEEVLAGVVSGEVMPQEAVERCSVSWETLKRRLRERGLKRALWVQERRRAAAVYDRFLRGETIRQLAAEVGTSVGGLAQTLRRHRLRAGAPYKRPKTAETWRRHKEAPA